MQKIEGITPFPPSIQAIVDRFDSHTKALEHELKEACTQRPALRVSY